MRSAGGSWVQFRHEPLEATLKAFGQVKTRAGGDVVSVELACEGKTVFSFQIAPRSAQLEPPATAPWTDVLPTLATMARFAAVVLSGTTASLYPRRSQPGVCLMARPKDPCPYGIT